MQPCLKLSVIFLDLLMLVGNFPFAPSFKWQFVIVEKFVDKLKTLSTFAKDRDSFQTHYTFYIDVELEAIYK